MASFWSMLLPLLAVGSYAKAILSRDNLTATVDVSSSNGSPQHLASGFIYGIPDNYPNQIPGSWYENIDFQYARVGGAQLPQPAAGWIYGETDYLGRLESTQLNYETAREYGAKVILLVHDIWGTDGANSSTVWPGDNGNWANYDLYISTLLNDLYTRNMLTDLVIDIWNEPDLTVFWNRPLQQWVDLFIRTFKAIRADSRFNSVQITGPSLANMPVSTNLWWTTFLSQIASNHTIPDQWSYHLEGSYTNVEDDPQYTSSSLAALLKTYGLPTQVTNINEYATYEEMVPAGYAWWIARLERYNFWGLLGNWQSGYTLHDLFANLLTKTDDPFDYTATDYAAAPGYWVYKYYTQNMTGERLVTTGSTDRLLDVYATKDSSTVRLLVGSRITEGTWEVEVTGLSSIGYGTSGTVTINTWGFGGDDPLTPQAAPTFENTVAHTFTDNTLTFPIYQTDTYHAWAFEFPVL
ncbi:glycoside hydrolase superfamily [Xylariaceae sp. FL0255]|nr:glycoside hydrolase superfamily [Xylariaceae sp. FL0255]